MAGSYTEDKQANKLSIMNQKKIICTGEQTGFQCKHYWYINRRISSNNAYELIKGEQTRQCTVVPGWPFEWEDDDIPTECNRFDPNIDKPYDPAMESFETITKAQRDEILAQSKSGDVSEEPKNTIESFLDPKSQANMAPKGYKPKKAVLTEMDDLLDEMDEPGEKKWVNPKLVKKKAAKKKIEKKIVKKAKKKIAKKANKKKAKKKLIKKTIKKTK